tara:strand:- start:746 stop:883 length:138 start_codon:yes stop_codon:yes gene_type:complete
LQSPSEEGKLEIRFFVPLWVEETRGFSVYSGFQALIGRFFFKPLL